LHKPMLMFKGEIQGLNSMSLLPVMKEFVLGITVVSGPKSARLI